MKLEVIDEFLERGYELPDNPLDVELYPVVDTEEMDL